MKRFFIPLYLGFGRPEPDNTPGSSIAAEHIIKEVQGHIDQKETRLGNLWQTYFQLLGVKVPDNFQGGEADGIVKELV